MSKKVIISGIGCYTADYLYNGIDFHSPVFRKYLSRQTGDGGLSPGKLVFTGELEKFANKPYFDILKDITTGKKPVFNLGGPSIVSLANAAQLLFNEPAVFNFHGGYSNDDIAQEIREAIGKLPVNTDHFKEMSTKPSPFTDVFSDPQYNDGHGERTFVNNIGAAMDIIPDNISEEFYKADFTCFGGTALVPVIHDELETMLEKARGKGAFTLVNTVYDFRNEKKNPGAKWPLGKTNKTFQLTDLLIVDLEEALKISGTASMGQAMQYFQQQGLKAAIITNGSNPVRFYAREGRFSNCQEQEIPVSREIISELKQNPSLKGDTTGCGDNFVGGVLASLVWQMIHQPVKAFDIKTAISWGVASGGFACYYHGGTYHEQKPGEKLQKVEYFQQLHAKNLPS